MKLLFLILFFALSFLPYPLVLFELVFGFLLLVPIAYPLVAQLFESDVSGYYALFLLSALTHFAYIILRIHNSNVSLRTFFRRIGTDAYRAGNWDFLLVFSTSFLSLNYLSSLWPDFYSIGERMRDVALLGAVLRNPIETIEPWMSGVGLNYYTYWYRFGHFLYHVLGLTFLETYQFLVAFALSFYLTTLYRFFHLYLTESRIRAWLLSICVCFACNPASIEYLFKAEATWWYPTRIIQGAIHEFPVWSFILGDAHPHYLDVAMIPFFFLVASRMFFRCRTIVDCVFMSLIFICIPALFFYNANAWEVPVWMAYCGVMFGLYLLSARKITFAACVRGVGIKHIFAAIVFIVLASALWLNGSQFIGVDSAIRLVGGDVPRTKVVPFLLHFGFWLSGFVAVLALLLPKRASFLFLLFLTLSLWMSDSAIVALICIFVFSCWRLFEERIWERSSITFGMLMSEAMVIFSILLLIVPELVYLDDSYSGIHERMNTVFKLYYVNWFFLSYSSFYLFRKYFEKRPLLFKRLCAEGALCALVVVSSLFLAKVIPLREVRFENANNVSPGLGTIESRYPGAGSAVHILMNAPAGTVVETWGSSYSDTTFVSTLSYKQSYLGWIEHLMLLYPQLSREIMRRRTLVDALYLEADCLRKAELMRGENLRYLVYGPAERAKYGKERQTETDCMRPIVSDAEIRIYDLEKP